FSLAGHQPRAYGGETAAEIEGLEVTPELRHAAIASGEIGADRASERVAQLRGTPAFERHASGISGERRSAADHVHAPAEALDPRAGSRTKSIAQPIDARAEFVVSRDDHLGGGGRRWRAQIGDEVGNRHVGLVADR